MPITFALNDRLDLVVTRLIGDVELEDILAYFKDYGAHPKFRPGRDMLLDLSGWTGTQMGYDEMRAVRQAERALYQVTERRKKCSIYAPEELQYGMARIYVSLAEAAGDSETEVFGNYETACRYLGFSASEMPPPQNIRALAS